MWKEEFSILTNTPPKHVLKNAFKSAQPLGIGLNDCGISSATQAEL